MSFMDELRKIPPVTRFLCGATLAVSIPPMLQLVSVYKILFVSQLVTQKGEFWRIFTSFFYGGSGISFLFDFMMLYRNSNGLEEVQYLRRSYDYAWQLLIASGALLALNIPLNSYLHFRPLLMTLLYISSKLNPNAITSLFGLIAIPAQYFPFVMLAMDFVMGGGPKAAASSLTGIIVGHAWWMLEHRAQGGSPYGRAPAWVKSLVSPGSPPPPPPTGNAGAGGTAAEGMGGMQAESRGFGTAFAARDGGVRRAGGSSTTTTTTASTGYQWGSGRRLGE
ncbi:DER1-domain-containing protein [Sistotremastrum niveocremeum HHB9708]|uniref:Derlin n=1 Tax=Sistotremastrum niveocremeum HHB9708 TaxID=1314777 RepID=A0A164YXB0_9AGAM|nr:DER1-domain-containing protein [Sistotremastrum niveocremeum HHB9708]